MKIQNKTNLIFTHKMIKAFADSMIKVFMPLIIYKASNNMLFAIIYLCAFTSNARYAIRDSDRG